MPRTRIQKRLPFAANDLMTFVADVERYPDFISVVSALRIIGPRTIDGPLEQFEAEMSISYMALSERVRCHVSVDRPAQRIDVRKSGQDGALRSLSNSWVFHTLSDGSTWLDFTVDVTLKSAPLNFLARQKFDVVAKKIMEKFTARAHDVCSKVSGESSSEIEEEIQRLMV